MSHVLYNECNIRYAIRYFVVYTFHANIKKKKGEHYYGMLCLVRDFEIIIENINGNIISNENDKYNQLY